jgi:hypothetical protein
MKVAALANRLLLLAALAASSACDARNTADAPSCVLLGNEWTCPPDDTRYPNCPNAAGACDYDGGTCFACGTDRTGETCQCASDGGPGGAQWLCLPAEVACGK